MSGNAYFFENKSNSLLKILFTKRSKKLVNKKDKVSQHKSKYRTLRFSCILAQVYSEKSEYAPKSIIQLYH